MRLRNRNELRGIPRPADYTVGLVHVHEHFVLGEGQAAVVARMGLRWFVLTGQRGAALSTYEVAGPFESHGDALLRAYGLEVAS